MQLPPSSLLLPTKPPSANNSSRNNSSTESSPASSLKLPDRGSRRCSPARSQGKGKAPWSWSSTVTVVVVAERFTTAPSSSGRLAEKVAVVTGAANSVGKATVAEFIKNGASVALANINDDVGQSVAAELDPCTSYVRCDVADEVRVVVAVDHPLELHGHLDVLYSNAGISGSMAPVPLGSLDMAEFDRAMAGRIFFKNL